TASPAHPMAQIGLQLYTVRESCARDFEGTLREVAATGYAGVEVFDLHGHSADRVKGWLDELGLVVCGRHATLDVIEAGLSALGREASTLGWTRLSVSWVDPGLIESAPHAVRDRLAPAA